jgi:hypothetical protein
MRPLQIGQTRSPSISGIFRNGLMLVSSDTSGLLVGKKQQNLGQNLPAQSSYDSAPIYKRAHLRVPSQWRFR